jgi:hypothetical protein
MTQAEAVKKAVGEFGALAKAKLNDGGQPEDQLRNPLEQLFAAISIAIGLPKDALTLVGEKSLSELRTRPDFAVNVQKALIGFIEVKAPGKGADPRKWKAGHDKEQWDKLKALPNLLYSDGNAFSLWRDGVLVGSIIKLDGDIETSGAKLNAPDGFLPLIDNFLSWKPIAPKNPKELARISARLCRFLRDEVIEQLSVDNAKLSELKDDWKALLFPDADDSKFADGYAQAVTFGLLMAKSKGLSLADGLDRVAKELGKSNTLIGTALDLLTRQDLSLGPSLDTLTRVFDVVDWNVIAKGDPEAWLYFYEDFLEVYDSKLRKQTGSYYTPPEVVQTMVRLCDEALRSSDRFAVPLGLASPEVHIADPATGSGTFLLAVLRAIAASVTADVGAGQVAGAITDAAKRLYGFELQFGAFAVAQLRLLAEMIDLGADGTPEMFVTDTLSDPHAPFESGQGIYREISKSQRQAGEIKRAQPITVVIGNPPYKEKAKGKGAWIESGSGNIAAPLNDWQPPKEWKAGAHSHKLRNLYVYFWRWAAWKVFEQGAGGKDKEPPVEEHLSGMVCYITVSGFLNGPGFQKMRADLRRDCDDIWVIDCSPEGLQPAVSSRIFQGVQQPVCIVLASRSPSNDPLVSATVRYRALPSGHRSLKFKSLDSINLMDGPWSLCSTAPRDPFLPAHSGGWADFVAVENIIGDCGLGVMPGRTWVIAPDAESLRNRWNTLVTEKSPARRELLFHPHQNGDRTVHKAAKSLIGDKAQRASVESLVRSHEGKLKKGEESVPPQIDEPIRYAVRSFDRQWIIPDNRLLNRPSPTLWEHWSPTQTYLTVLSRTSPKGGPAITATGIFPDLDHYNGRGGRVFALWKDAAATQANIAPSALAELAKAFGAPVDQVDVFAYVAALLACPAYTAKFKGDLIRPGLRVPLTADAALFAEAAALGRDVIWLQSFGERFAEGKPAGPPRLPEGCRPDYPKAGTISMKPEDFPDTLDYDATKQRLKIGTGYIDQVPPAVWAYEVSGKQVLRQWFSYRKKNRERPQIGDKRKPSPLSEIQPDHWLPEYTGELINVLNVLGMLVDLEPKQADLLERVCDGPLIPNSRVSS